MKRSFQVLIVAALLGGCAQYSWFKQGATRDDFNRDSYQCQMEAANAYPTLMVRQQLTSGYTTPATTSCYGNNTAWGSSSMNCTTLPGQNVAPTYMNSDANADNRLQAARNCMFARGYQLRQVK